MNAILLSAGYGKRLMPLTANTPKCLMEVGGKAIIDYWIEDLSKNNIKKILINTHYLHNHVINHVDKNHFNKNISTTFEEKLLGTAGTLLKNLNFYEGSEGILLHVDNYCPDIISQIIDSHKKRPDNCIITIGTFLTNRPKFAGILTTNEKGIMTGFIEKPERPNGNIANSAIYILSTEFIDTYKTNFKNAINFAEDVLPNLNGKVYTHLINKEFVDIGTPDTYKYANLLASR